MEYTYTKQANYNFLHHQDSKALILLLRPQDDFRKIHSMWKHIPQWKVMGYHVVTKGKFQAERRLEEQHVTSIPLLSLEDLPSCKRPSIFPMLSGDTSSFSHILMQSVQLASAEQSNYQVNIINEMKSQIIRFRLILNFYTFLHLDSKREEKPRKKDSKIGQTSMNC